MFLQSVIFPVIYWRIFVLYILVYIRAVSEIVLMKEKNFFFF